jgi:hypothetical protein
MVAVDFAYGMFIHDAQTLVDYIIGDRREPSYRASPQGDVKISGSGRRRWSSRRGISEEFAVTLRVEDDDVLLWVEQLKGKTVLYRDMRSRLHHAIVTNITVEDLHSSCEAIVNRRALYDIGMDFKVVDEALSPVEGSEA